MAEDRVEELEQRVKALEETVQLLRKELAEMPAKMRRADSRRLG